MTYLELVNSALTRLRENSVSTVSQTTYSAMVGAFINDAKRQIEQAWDWNANRQILTISTVADTSTVTLTGAGLESKILSSWNDTKNSRLRLQSQAWFDKQNYGGVVASPNTPSNFCWRGDDTTDSIIELWPTPDAVYSLKFNTVTNQADLSSDSTVLNIPPRPVFLLAVAMLAEEKGETGGSTSARYFEMADKALSDSIAFDAAKHSTENIWYEV